MHQQKSQPFPLENRLTKSGQVLTVSSSVVYASLRTLMSLTRKRRHPDARKKTLFFCRYSPPATGIFDLFATTFLHASKINLGRNISLPAKSGLTIPRVASPNA